ncbi:MAG: HTH domain-containing protein [Bacteroidales bacterium]|nr:HTH domain-containing protein [Bacteroidales bacterium]
MNRFAFFDKLILLEKLIRQECTGTPDQLAERLSVSRRTVYNMIDILESYDAKIEFIRRRQTFCYTDGKFVDITIDIKLLTDMTAEELVEVSGGAKLNSSLFYSVLFSCTEELYLCSRKYFTAYE